MFKTREALNREKHATLKFEPNIGYRFAANEMLVPLVSGEITSVARDYVVVFDKTRPIAYALLGIEKDVNAYVTEKGQWRGRYRPAFIRAYPFALVRTPGQEDVSTDKVNYTIVIDPEAPQLKDPDGEPFFDVDGNPTPLVKKVQKVLTSLQQDSLRTEKLIRQLDEGGLLVERHIEVKKGGTALTGFRSIDPKKLGQLSGDELAALRNTGALMLAYSQMLSLNNLHDSPISWAAKSEDQTGAPSDRIRGLFSEDDDFDLDLDFIH